ncbi:MAG: glucosaminidase domain-containing protein [Chitinophagaceae bacterium]|nr:glucosaminidase domain-containing protein [Chitinophagaceae bacterium]
MQKIRNSIVVFLLLVTSAVFAQKKEVVSNYINTYKDIAVAEMKRTGVPAAITLAQGIHESGAGNSKLVLESNNHFGIKCKSNWTGESVKHDDDAKAECFRKYPASEQSYKDHSNFLKNGQRYASLFELDPTDYKGWANGLKKAGYATNPKYPEVLIKLIEDYNLQDFTFLALKNELVIKEAIAKNEQSATNETIPAKISVQKENVINYPSGQFKINDTKVVFVKKGTSFLSIAKQYEVDLSKIFEFNEISRSEITENDQSIYLQRKRKTGNNDFHIVQPGENLFSIAQQEAIRLESLRELNWLNEEDKPAVGERLNLKSKSPSMPKLAVKENYSLVPAVKNQGSN